MGVLEIILGIVLILLAVLIVLVIMKQEGNENGMNVISGSNSFMDKSRPMTMSDRLAKWTKWIAGIFFVLVLVAMLITNL